MILNYNLTSSFPGLRYLYTRTGRPPAISEGKRALGSKVFQGNNEFIVCGIQLIQGNNEKTRNLLKRQAV